MRSKILAILVLFSLTAVCIFAQGINTTAAKDDWEEINYEFDSDILVDGFPSLLRLAELLNQNPTYRLSLIGHADYRGSDQYNVDLSRRRANAVREFLIKYGANDNQIVIEPQGESTPRVDQRSPEALFMNRRVAMTLRDGDGKIIKNNVGVGEAINGLEELTRKQEECCNKILSKLDEVLNLLKGLQDENAKLKDDVAALKSAQDGIKRDVAAQPAPPTKADVEQAVRAALPEPGKRFSTLSVNVGPASPDGNISVSGQGRTFVPFGERYAVQAQGEFLHYFGRDEGQMDLGLVTRFGKMQAGGFSSFKYVKFSEFENAGALGQASVTLDYVFNRGRVGFFGTKGFLDGAVVNRALLQRHLFQETYLKIVDQAGVSAAVGAWGDSWFEGNVGAMFRSGGSNKPGGTLRYIHPLSDKVALTFEGGLNETLITNNNTGRFVVGLQFGGWLSPKDYNVDTERPVPVDVPRIRYEVLTRTIREGNDPPVADAGPDLIGVTAGPITLDGSASFDPDQDPITYEWQQIAGPTVTLNGPTSASASFTADEGQTYQFRLTVRDDHNGIGTDRVTVSTLNQVITVNRFIANPTNIKRGGSSTLSWDIQNATEASITPGVGTVDPQSGSVVVSPTVTTTYTLTAKNAKNTVTATTIVTVEIATAQIVDFLGTPTRITRGQTATLSWGTLNADTVSIAPGIGTVAQSGTRSVQPNSTTTYTLTATGFDGNAVTRSVTIEVDDGLPRIVRFSAAPPIILPGENSTLTWEVENATEISISNVGPADASGNRVVSPGTTTVYVITATNASGQTSESLELIVENPVKILEFQAKPSVPRKPGDPVTLSWKTENATKVVISGVGEVANNGSVIVRPMTLTTYTLIAYGRGNQSVEATVIVKIEIANRAPIAVAVSDRAILVPAGTTTGRGTLDGSQSRDPDNDPITFEWSVIGTRQARVLNPTAMNPTVEFLGGYGDYEFQLIVRDDKMAQGVDTVKVLWVDP